MGPVKATATVDLRSAESRENFPVALRVLPRALREDLRAVYDVVRTVDELGDSVPGDRMRLLTEFSADLSRAFTSGNPQSPVLGRLLPTIGRRGLSELPFQRLVQANVQDQQVFRYETWDDLLGYCALSAAPIGRMVLEIFDAGDPRRVELSDRVCTALQLLEHWQDVAEDRRAGRTYLPQQDLRRVGVDERELTEASASPALRSLIREETRRAAALLDSGAPLVRELRGWARLAVAGYLAGGRATVDALLRCEGDVLRATPRPRTRDVLRHAVSLLLPLPFLSRSSLPAAPLPAAPLPAAPLPAAPLPAAPLPAAPLPAAPLPAAPLHGRVRRALTTRLAPGRRP